MKKTAIRGVPVDLAEVPEADTRRPSNGLRRLSGTWSEEEFRQFEEAVAPLGEIDRDLWRLPGIAPHGPESASVPEDPSDDAPNHRHLHADRE